MEEIEIFYPENEEQWRQWLNKHHLAKQSVWVIFKNKKSGHPTLSWSEAVDHALCFGWIDSKKVKVDEFSSKQFFSKRKPKSTWSKINKDKIEKLTKEGLMSPAGLAIVKEAQANGSWTLLDEVENLIVPEDLLTALQNDPNAFIFFESLSKSVKKILLQWLVLAKTAETRQKRINEITTCAGEGKKPKNF